MKNNTVYNTKYSQIAYKTELYTREGEHFASILYQHLPLCIYLAQSDLINNRPISTKIIPFLDIKIANISSTVLKKAKLANNFEKFEKIDLLIDKQIQLSGHIQYVKYAKGTILIIKNMSLKKIKQNNRYYSLISE